MIDVEIGKWSVWNRNSHTLKPSANVKRYGRKWRKWEERRAICSDNLIFGRTTDNERHKHKTAVLEKYFRECFVSQRENDVSHIVRFPNCVCDHIM